MAADHKSLPVADASPQALAAAEPMTVSFPSSHKVALGELEVPAGASS